MIITQNTQNISQYQKIIGHLRTMWSMLKVTDYIVEPVERKVIQNFIHKHHYSHNTNGIQQMECFALFSEGKFGFDKKMIGAALYAIPSMPSTAS